MSLGGTEFKIRDDGTRLWLYQRSGKTSEWLEVPTGPFHPLDLQEAVDNFYDAENKAWAAKEQVVPLAEFMADSSKYIKLIRNGPVRVVTPDGKTHCYMS